VLDAPANVVLILPFDPNRPPMTGSVRRLQPGALPPPPDGSQRGSTSFQVLVTVVDPSTSPTPTATVPPASQTPPDQLPLPMELIYTPTPADLDLAGGDIGRIRLAQFINNSWIAVSCAVDADNGVLICTLPRHGLFSVVILPSGPAPGPFETALPNGRFFKEANGFDGFGATGFVVFNDADAQMWSEFQRLGGVDMVGYPISNRFLRNGLQTQVFQKLVLQWHPELGRAVAIDVLDELSRRGVDGWLATFREIPPMVNLGPDQGLSADALAQRQMALLSQVPALPLLFAVHPEWIAEYGLPRSVKDYGSFVIVRLQRAAIELRLNDDGGGPGIIVRNAGELGAEVGMWPSVALGPHALGS
jgi:hypothetical protein